MRPLIRWAGSKRGSLAVLAEHTPAQFGCYFEPFVGSAALFFHLQPREAVLGDINAELINAYRMVRATPRKLLATVQGRPGRKPTYIRMRKQKPSGMSAFDRAVRFFYLNRHCFNGLYRTNRSGMFNVPFSARKVGSWPDYSVFRRSAALLRDSRLVTGDFEKTLQTARKGDFCYLDPPYRLSHRRSFVEYSPDCFSNNDLSRLISRIQALDRAGVHVLFTYAPSSRVTKALTGWKRKQFQVARSMSGFAGTRRSYGETLWFNF